MNSGKTALVTGAAVRIGRSISLRLASEGINIVVHYRNSRKEAESLAGELEKLEVDSWLLRSDFGNDKEYENLIDEAFDCAGEIDFLINSASIFPAGSVSSLSWDDLSRNISINAWVPFYLGRSFASRAINGAIVNILDSRIRGYDPGHTAYLLSKKVLEYFTEIMAVEFAPGIRVNGVAPGLILPPQGKDENYLTRLTRSVPLKRHGNEADIAETVAFLIKNDFITGQIIYVDGGMSLI
jgi:hypothetical protein